MERASFASEASLCPDADAQIVAVSFRGCVRAWCVAEYNSGTTEPILMSDGSLESL